jgi:RNA polymerase sigma-70 factor (ECF subfamily)
VLFRDQGGQVWRAIMAMSLGRRVVADDATAEAFARLFDRRESVRDPLAWAFRTAFRLAAADLARERRLPPTERSAQPPSGTELPGELSDALAMLSPDQRLAVFLHYYADYSVREVARICGCPATTVKVRLHRARRRIAAHLDPMEAPNG